MQRALFLAAVLTAVAVPAPAAAQWLGLQTPGLPRNADGSVDMTAPAPVLADGRPDLSGIWYPADATGELFEAEKIQPWARDLMIAHERAFYGDDPRFHCLPSGPGIYPAGRSASGTRRMVHTPAFIAVLNSDLTYRQIFVDGRSLEENPFPTWLGYSVGHWEGDTLVVESNGYNDKTWLNRKGLHHTEQLRITERYRRPDFGHIELEVTYEDPGTFEEPVTASIELRLAADTEILESVCNEDSVGRTYWDGAISQAEENVVEVDAAVLATYVGTYEGTWLGNAIRATVTLEDGGLFLERTPPYSEGGNTASAKSELVALSDNAFECICGLGFTFNLDESGTATELLEVHVSGAWPFRRVR